MKIPKGMTEKEVIACIDYIARTLSPSFTFGYYDKEDIEQECRVLSLEALDRYDSKKGALSTFLMNHVRNRLINLRRDKLYRMPPECTCKSCQKGKACKKMEKRMTRWKKINTSKRDLMEIGSLCDISYDKSDDSIVESDEIVLRKELVSIINQNLPILMRADYRRLIDGVKLPKRRRDKIISKIFNILEELEYGK